MTATQPTLTWTKTDAGYIAEGPAGTSYVLTKTPGRRFAIEYRTTTAVHTGLFGKPGTLAAAKDVCQAHCESIVNPPRLDNPDNPVAVQAFADQVNAQNERLGYAGPGTGELLAAMMGGTPGDTPSAVIVIEPADPLAEADLSRFYGPGDHPLGAANEQPAPTCPPYCICDAHYSETTERQDAAMSDATRPRQRIGAGLTRRQVKNAMRDALRGLRR